MYWDEKLQKWMPGSGPQGTGGTMPTGLGLPEQAAWQRDQAEQLKAKQDDAQFDDRLADKKPLFASNPLREAGVIAGNALTGLGTDYVDLFLGAVDSARAYTSHLTNQKQGGALYFNPTEVFNDADNPLTRWRRETFKTESIAGEAVSQIVRIGTSLMVLPKVGAAGALAPARAVGKIAGAADKVESAVGSIGKLFSKSKETESILKGLQAVEFAGGKTPMVGEAAQKAIKTAKNNSYLFATFDELGTAASKGGAEAQKLDTVSRWMANTADAVTRTFRVPGKSTVRTVGEAFAWDAFVAFNVSGEGDQSMDETIGDMLTSSGIQWLQPLGSATTTYSTDAAIVTKGKQVAEGLLTGAALEYVMGLGRIWRFANDFRRANPEEQAKILRAFQGYSQTIGEDLAKVLPPGKPGGELVPQTPGGPMVGPPRPPAPPPGPTADAATEATGRQWPWSTEPPGAMVRDGVIPADVQVEGPRVADTAALPGAPEPPMLPGARRGLEGTPERPQLPGAGGTDGATAPEALQSFIDSGEVVPVSVRQISTPVDERFVWTPALVRDMASKEMEGTLKKLSGSDPAAPRLPQWTQAGLREAIQNIISKVSSDEIGITPENVKAMQEGIVKMLPGRRTELMDLLMQDPTRLNMSGMHNAADGIWKDYIKRRALSEGWGAINENFGIDFRRSDALRMDSEDAVFRQADALDNVAEDAQFQITPIDQKAAEDIAQQEAMAVAGQKAEQQGVPIDLQATAMQAAQEADHLANSEAARRAVLSRAADSRLPQRLTDDEAVQAFLGGDLETLAPRPTVQKAAQGRAWEVVDAEGQVLSRSTTKRGADVAAEQEYQRNQRFIVNQARQLEIDDTAKTLGIRVGDPIVDSPITSKIKVSEAQVRAARGIDNALDQVLQGVIGKSGTIELSVTEMNRVARVLSEAAQQASGAQKVALNKLSDRIGVAMKSVEPEARARQNAEWLAQQAKTQVTDGIFCDFL